MDQLFVILKDSSKSNKPDIKEGYILKDIYDSLMHAWYIIL